jgi:hypothetical protein
LCKQAVRITTDDIGVYHLIWQDGTTGTNPPMAPPEIGRFIPIDEYLKTNGDRKASTEVTP